jgi:hypothetical protein
MKRSRTWTVLPLLLLFILVFAGTALAEDTPESGTQYFNSGWYNNFLIAWIFAGFVLGWIWAAGKKLSPFWAGGFLAYTGLFMVLIYLQKDMAVWKVFPVLAGPGLAVGIPLLAGRQERIYIRPIPAISAVEEAIGRATEMGKPILFVPGISTIDDIATLAALNILSPVAEKAAQYDSRLIVPNSDPIVYTVTQEIVKESYLKAGRPDAYSDENVFFIAAMQFPYAAAVNGIMVRDRPATNFFLGTFYAESLLLAETGNMTGAIQIAGTDMPAQLPFFIVACDYTLIGEELYAAGAYISRDPAMLGSIKGQDWTKLLVAAAIVVGTLGTTLGWFQLAIWFQAR